MVQAVQRMTAMMAADPADAADAEDAEVAHQSAECAVHAVHAECKVELETELRRLQLHCRMRIQQTKSPSAAHAS